MALRRVEVGVIWHVRFLDLVEPTVCSLDVLVQSRLERAELRQLRAHALAPSLERCQICVRPDGMPN